MTPTDISQLISLPEFKSELNLKSNKNRKLILGDSSQYGMMDNQEMYDVSEEAMNTEESAYNQQNSIMLQKKNQLNLGSKKPPNQPNSPSEVTSGLFRPQKSSSSPNLPFS